MDKGIGEILAKIQKELVAPKGQFNSFGKYKFRSCEDILEALKGYLPDGVYIVVEDVVEAIGDRVYVKATATISNGLSSIASTAYAREQQDKKGMDQAQITGAASSYARKYALNGLFLIDDNKDPDTRNPDGEVVAKVDDAKKQVSEYFIRYNECVVACWDEISTLKESIANNNLDLAIGAWMDISEDAQIIIYRLAPTKGGILTTEERKIMKSDEWAAARNNIIK